MKAVIYARCSSSNGEQHVENQIEQLKSWASSRGWDIVAIYQENESAWKAGHQRELARLKTDAAKRKFDAVLVWALDRLSREGALAILQFVSTLKVYGVKVISYQESWTEAPGELAEVLYAIAGWVARMESQRRSERTKAGLARVKASGKKLGRPSGSRDRHKRNVTSRKSPSFNLSGSPF